VPSSRNIPHAGKHGFFKMLWVSIHSKAEIPYDVTEMTASALNSIGGNVAFIPYRPDVMTNLQNL